MTLTSTSIVFQGMSLLVIFDIHLIIFYQIVKYIANVFPRNSIKFHFILNSIDMDIRDSTLNTSKELSH